MKRTWNVDFRNPKRYPTTKEQQEAFEKLKDSIEISKGMTGWERSFLFELWCNPVLDLGIKSAIEIILDMENRPLWSADSGGINCDVGLTYALNGKSLFTISSDETVKQWESNTGQLVRVFPRKKANSGAMAVSPNGQSLAVGGWDGSIILIDLISGKSTLLVGEADEEDIGEVHFSPKGDYLLTCGLGNSRKETVKLRDASTGAFIRDYGRDRMAYSASFCPNGKEVLTGNYQRVCMWDTERGHLLDEWIGGKAEMVGVMMSSNKQFLLSMSAGSALVWDVPSRKLLYQFPSYDVICGLDFSPDSEFVTSRSTRTTLSFWSLRLGKEHRRLDWFSDAVAQVKFSPSGDTIAVSAWDGTVKLWKRSAILSAEDEPSPSEEDR